MTASTKSYRLRPASSPAAERRVKVGIYLLPSIYQRIKMVALKRNQLLYQVVEDALAESLKGDEEQT